MQKLLIATTNDGKLKEIKHFLADLPFEIVGLGDLDKKIEEPEETENTFSQQKHRPFAQAMNTN